MKRFVREIIFLILCFMMVQPAYAADTIDSGKIIWTSSDTSVAKVTEDGMVIPVRKGTVTITATYADTKEITASVEVTINAINCAHCQGTIASADENASHQVKCNVDGCGKYLCDPAHEVYGCGHCSSVKGKHTKCKVKGCGKYRCASGHKVYKCGHCSSVKGNHVKCESPGCGEYLCSADHKL